MGGFRQGTPTLIHSLPYHFFSGLRRCPGRFFLRGRGDISLTMGNRRHEKPNEKKGAVNQFFTVFLAVFVWKQTAKRRKYGF